jgi:hypothetical protein
MNVVDILKNVLTLIQLYNIINKLFLERMSMKACAFVRFNRYKIIKEELNGYSKI